MASVHFIIDRQSGAVIRKLGRDGRQRGEYPSEFYDVVSNNPTPTIRYRLKPEFDAKIFITEAGQPRFPSQREEFNTFLERLAIGAETLMAFKERRQSESDLLQTQRTTQSNNNLRNALLVGGALLLL